MKSAHKVKAYRNNTDTAGKAAFLGSYLTKETVNIEKLCEQTAAQSGLTAIQVRAILEGSFDAIAELEISNWLCVNKCCCNTTFASFTITYIMNIT